MAQESEQYNAERERIKARREYLGLQEYAREQKTGRPWGLALSGGGIRSATFCLGVLQALARTQRTERPEEKPLLARFDYLSTVSGGGYIGSFFSSLFLPNRLRGTVAGQPPQTPHDAAQDAYAVFRYEPPGKISTATDYSSAPVGSGPGAWLRENGRYLTPTGGGDMFYALAMAWRNWLSLHFVIGMPLVLALSFLFLVQTSLGINLFVWPLLALVVLALPCTLAYWLIIPRGNLDEAPSLANLAYRATIGVTAALLVLSLFAYVLGDSPRVAVLAFCFAVIAGAGVLITLLLVRKLALNDAGNTLRNYRVLITRYLSNAIIAVVTLLFLASVATLAQDIYGFLFKPFGLVSVGMLPALIWLVRKLALLKDEKVLPAWLLKLPLEVLALIGGILMGMVVCLSWALFVLWVATGGRDQVLSAQGNLSLWILGALALALIVVAARFVGFLNLSSLHTFYASRLTRAYLGASNGRRFTASSGAKERSVAEPLVDDDIPLDTYYGTKTAGPLHLINVTMNLTVDPAEQLVQRDRKGKPLCLAPHGWTANGGRPTNFMLDGVSYLRGPSPSQLSEIMLPLSLGQWIGTSGAAFSTGLGRTTSLGMSLALGLANVRLGVWWSSQFLYEGETHYRHKDPRWVRRFPTQSYLFYELTAHFHGHRRDLHYLSDGGHFENTAAYELIRRERDIALIVLCDCGCDPSYQFDDLANLVRLARIDQQLEIREDVTVQNHPVLNQVFGSISHFQEPPTKDTKKCALLLEVFDTTDKAEAPLPQCRILVLKPRLIASLTPDVLNYALVNEAFPNQTTADQFFDEAQFESYRQLGLSIGRMLFGEEGTANPVSSALWHYLNLP
ncbi:patatin-like phospholipase family protein [Pseudomonas defluvii]|uniref:patatin-like phospholipase family protein n=1 Tax=Pseudomonas defluvii TaxID=1876757 RepID=UPI003905B9B3